MQFIPGTRALKTLTTAARHLNFTRAADELGLTPAAVSYQIKEFEDHLGIVIFVRAGKTMRLTEAGRILCDAAQEAIEDLNRAVAKAQKLTRGTSRLRVSLDPQLATKWLMRRVEHFRERYPDIELRFDVAYEMRDFDMDDIDVAIRFGTGKYPGLCADRLFENVIVPVCSPRLISPKKPLKEPKDILQYTLAHIEWSRRGITWPNWRMWLAAAGVTDFDDSNILQFSSTSDALHAALSGEAIALADYALVESDLEEGKLIQPFALSIRIPAEFGYFLVYPESSAHDPRIHAFREWILEEVNRVKT